MALWEMLPFLPKARWNPVYPKILYNHAFVHRRLSKDAAYFWEGKHLVYKKKHSLLEAHKNVSTL